jgi:hypothetical protein
MTRWLVLALLVGCTDKPKMTMTAEQVISAVRDFADRGCVCETDKECFQAIRDEWDAAKRDLVKNANLLTGADRDAYQAEHTRFALCGDRAGLAVFDRW